MASQVIDGSNTGIDGKAHEQTEKVFTYLCGALFTQADITISQKLPELLACKQTVVQTTPQAALTTETEAPVMLQGCVKTLNSGKKSHRRRWAGGAQLYTARAQITARKDTKKFTIWSS